MYKIFFFIHCSIICPCLANAQQNDFSNKDLAFDYLIEKAHTSIQFRGETKLLDSILTYSFVDDMDILANRDIITLDGDGNTIFSEGTEYSIDGEIIGSSEETRSYDENNNLISAKNFIWNEDAGDYILYTEWTYIYDEESNQTLRQYQRFNNLGETAFGSKQEHFYTGSVRDSTHDFDYETSLEDFVLDQRHFHTTEDDKLISTLYLRYDEVLDIWNNYWLRTYNYNNDGLQTGFETYGWNGTEFETPVLIQENEYDASNNIIKRCTELGNIFTGEFEPWNCFEWLRDECGNILSISIFDFEEDEYIQTQRIDYYYSIQSDSKDLASQNIQIYPNPVSDILYVTDTDLRNDFQIFNQDGKIIQTYSKQKTSIDLTNLKQGTYFLKIGNNIQRFVKI